MLISTRRSRSPAFSLGTPASVVNFLSSDDRDKYIDAREALKNSDIYSIIFQLSSDLADAKLKADAPRAQGILNDPTSTSNARAFWQAMYAQMLLGGESFAYRWRNNNGQDTRWEYLRPSQVSTFLLSDGSGLTYNVSFDEPEFGVVQNIPQMDMIHFRLLSQNGGMTGISPLWALATELQIKDQSNKLTLGSLARSVMSPGILKVQHGGKLNADLKAKRSKSFLQQVTASDAGPIVLDDLEDYTPLEVKSNVAQLLDQVSWTSAQIAKVYGVSDSMINGQGDQQSSVEMIQHDYVKCLSRYSRAIESELNNKLNSNIYMNLDTAVDPTGSDYRNNISNLVKSGTLAGNQGRYLLQQQGYLPVDLPDAKPNPNQSKLDSNGGGDNENDKEN